MFYGREHLGFPGAVSEVREQLNTTSVAIATGAPTSDL